MLVELLAPPRATVDKTAGPASGRPGEDPADHPVGAAQRARSAGSLPLPPGCSQELLCRHAPEELLERRQLECSGEPKELVETGISSPMLNLANVGAVDARLLPEDVMRPSVLDTKLADTSAQDGAIARDALTHEVCQI